MTPSQQAKAAGLKSLAVVQEMTGQSAQTLINWARNKPDLFRVVLAGCRALQEDSAYVQQSRLSEPGGSEEGRADDPSGPPSV